MKFSALQLLANASAASAHTIFVQFASGGTTNPVSYGIRTPTYDGPIQDVTSNSLACNGSPNDPKSSANIITVTAGSTVTAVWRHTLTSGADDVMDASHKGPTLAYMKKVTDATTDSGVGGGWFKIQQDGYNAGNWGTSKVISNGGLHSITIPSCIAPGQYLLRAEMIALHAASSAGGAQLYMECAQINVVGGTGSASPATYSIPGIYKANDPGLLVNIYSLTASSTYTIPGPDPFTCGAGSNPAPTTAAPVPTTTSAASPPPTTLKTTTSAAATTSAGPPAGGACAAKYAQCGGTGWTGAACCVSGSTCKASGAYYSQCQ